MWIIRITAWMDGDRKVDQPYQYKIGAGRAHTAVHRAMMAFHEDIGRYHSFHRLTTEVERSRPCDDSGDNQWTTYGHRPRWSCVV
jgi:hypothetical protein